MGFWDAEETGAERAARIKGENQAAEHARRQASKEDEREHKQQERWEAENARYRRAEYEADLAAWKKDPTGYERRYSSPFDVEDMPGDPSYDHIRARYQREQTRAQARVQPESGDSPLIVKLIGGAILLFVVLPALAKTVLPVIGGFINVVWTILLSAAAALTVLWIILQVTAGEDPVRQRRAQLFNPVRIGKVIYLVVREHLAERRDRKNAEK